MIYTPGLLIGAPPVLPPGDSGGSSGSGAEASGAGGGGASPPSLPPSLSWLSRFNTGGWCFGLDNSVCGSLPNYQPPAGKWPALQAVPIALRTVLSQNTCKSIANGVCLVFGAAVLAGLLYVALAAFLK